MNCINPTRTMIELDENDPKRWRWMSERAPEHETLEFLVAPCDFPPGSLPQGAAEMPHADGWCSYRFLGGTATFWAFLLTPSDSRSESLPEGARAEIVFPRRWRLKQPGRQP